MPKNGYYRQGAYRERRGGTAAYVNNCIGGAGYDGIMPKRTYDPAEAEMVRQAIENVRRANAPGARKRRDFVRNCITPRE